MTLTARARDAAGNEAAASITVVVDNAAPQSLLLTPASGAVVSGVVPIVAAGSALRSLEVLVDGISVARSRGSRIDVKFDTRRRLDGPMTVTAVGVDAAGKSTVSVASVSVDNIAVELLPRALSRRSHHGCERVVMAALRGPNLGLLVPPASHAVELCVPGGSPVRGRIEWHDRDGRRGRIAEVRSLRVWFDRQQLMAAIEAGIATGMIDPQADVAVSVVAEQRFVLGVEQVKVCGPRARR